MGIQKSKLKIDHTQDLHLSVINSITWSSDGQRLWIGFSRGGGGGFVMRDLQTGKSTMVVRPAQDATIDICVLSPNGQWIVASIGLDLIIYTGDGSVHKSLRDVHIGPSYQEPGEPDIGWSHDSKHFLSISYGRISIYDVETGEITRTLKLDRVIHYSEGPKRTYAITARWSPDGRFIASGHEDKMVRVWDVATGNLLKTMMGHQHGVIAVCWSPDSRFVASGSTDYSCRIWDVNFGECMKVLTGHHRYIGAIDWSHDGRWIATGSNDETVRVWDAKTGSTMVELSEQSRIGSIGFTHVAFSPNSLELAIADERSVYIYDVAKK